MTPCKCHSSHCTEGVDSPQIDTLSHSLVFPLCQHTHTHNTHTHVHVSVCTDKHTRTCNSSVKWHTHVCVCVCAPYHSSQAETGTRGQSWGRRGRPRTPRQHRTQRKLSFRPRPSGSHCRRCSLFQITAHGWWLFPLLSCSSSVSVYVRCVCMCCN